MALVSTRSSANAPPASRTKIQAAAITIIRWVSDPRMIVLSRPSGGFVEAVSEAADCGDDIGPKLLPYAGDENLDRVRITVEILIVDMLDQFGAGNHLALVVKQIAEQLVFLGGQLHRLAVQRHAAGTGVEPRSEEPTSELPSLLRIPYA